MVQILLTIGASHVAAADCWLRIPAKTSASNGCEIHPTTALLTKMAKGVARPTRARQIDDWTWKFGSATAPHGKGKSLMPDRQAESQPRPFALGGQHQPPSSGPQSNGYIG